MGVVQIKFPGNLAQVVSADDLRNIPSTLMVDGELYVVQDLNGLFAYDPGEVALDDGVNIIKPNDKTSLQAGRWVRDNDGFAPGPPGPAENTYTTLSAFKAQPITNKASRLVGASGITDGDFFWTIGDFTGRADDENIIKADSTPLSTGAWVRQQADSVSYSQFDAAPFLMTLANKVRETPSITALGAVGDNSGNQLTKIQDTINAAIDAGVPSLLVPEGTFRILDPIQLEASNIELVGMGRGSAIHLVNEDRAGAFMAAGTELSPLMNLRLRNFAIFGDATFTGGTPSTINGGGVDFRFVDDCDLDGLWISGFSDGGIAIQNGNYNEIRGCRVRFTAQGIAFNANAIDCYGNIAIGNRISDTGSYNGLHLEGSFGTGLGDGMLIGTVLADNIIRNSQEAGINIELAPNTRSSGNVVAASGLADSTINMGVKLFGSPRSSVSDTVTGGLGYGIVVGANSGNSAITGCVTEGNADGSCFVTDAAYPGGAPVAATNDVVVEGNRFVEGPVGASGNATISPPMLRSVDGEAQIMRPLSGANSRTTWMNSGGTRIWRAGLFDRGAGPDWSVYRDGLDIFAIEAFSNGFVRVNMVEAADDTAAAGLGVSVGAFYYTAAGVVHRRLT